jgi:hypothetical protein
MRWAEVERLAAGLDGVHLATRDGLRIWRLRGRLIARQLDTRSVVIRTGFDERPALLDRHPDVFSVPKQFRAHMMVVADLRAATPAVVEPVLDAAWALQSRA